MDGSNVCRRPPQIIYHQFIEKVSVADWEASLWSLKSFLMTQVDRCYYMYECDMILLPT